MKKIGIKVRQYTNEVSIVNNNDIERHLLKAILVSFGFLSILYVIFLGNMVFNIIERRTLETQGREVANEVMDFEAKYLAMSSKLDLAFSQSAGFKEAKATFATRKSLQSLGYNSGNVKLGNNEI